MAGEVTIRITTDASGAIQGIQSVNDNLGTMSASAAKSSDNFGASAASLVQWTEGVIGGATAAAKMIDAVNDIGVASLRARAGLDAMSNGHADEFVEKMTTATRGLVDDTDLMTKATFALSTGVVKSSTDMAKLAEDGAALGRVFGGDAAGGIDALTRALQMTGSTRAIRSLGIDAEATMTEFNKLRVTMGDEAGWKTTVMDQADATMRKLGESAYGTGTALERVKIIAGDVFEGLAENVSKGVEGLLNASESFWLIQAKWQGLNAVQHMGNEGMEGATNVQGPGPVVGTTGLRSNGVDLSSAPTFQAITAGPDAAMSMQDRIRAAQAREQTAIYGQLNGPIDNAASKTDLIRANTKEIVANYQGSARAASDLATATQNAATAAKKAADAAHEMTANQLLGGKSNTLAGDIARGADGSVSAGIAATAKKGSAQEADELAAAKRAKDQYMIATGQATAASIKEADMQDDLNKKVATGKITADQYYASLTQLYKAMEGGVKTTAELDHVQFNLALSQGATKNTISLGAGGDNVGTRRTTGIRVTAYDDVPGAVQTQDPFAAQVASADKLKARQADVAKGFSDMQLAGTTAAGIVTTGMGVAAGVMSKGYSEAQGWLSTLQAMASGTWHVKVDMTSNGSVPGAVNGSGTRLANW